MEKTSTTRKAAQLTFILAMIAAALNFSAVFIHYMRASEIRWLLVAAGIILIAFGLNAKRGSRSLN